VRDIDRGTQREATGSNGKLADATEAADNLSPMRQLDPGE
jgi:hypothetical protein